MKSARPISEPRGRVDAFKKALHALALGRRLKRHGIVRRGESTYRIVVFVLCGLWLNAPSIVQMADYVQGAVSPVEEAAIYLLLRSTRFELRDLLRSQFQDPKRRTKRDLMILDDTMTQVSGEKMEGCSFGRCGSRKKTILGHVIVGLYYLGAFMEGWLDFRLKIYQKHPKRPVGRPRKELVQAKARTKLDWALEMLKELVDWGYKGMTVVFDAWYAWPFFLADLVALGYHFVTRARWDSPVRVGGQVMTMQEFFDQQMQSYKRRGQTTTMYSQKIIELLGVGPVKAVCVRYWCEGDRCYKDAVLITDHLTWTGPEVLDAYQSRWRIEQAIEETKQCFGLENYHVRSWGSIHHYLTLSMLAFNVSQVMRQAETPAPPVPTLVVQFRLDHLAEQIGRGQQQVWKKLYWGIRELYDSTEFPEWEIVETLFQSVFIPNYQT